MKANFALTLLFLSIFSLAFAQNAALHLTLANGQGSNCIVSIPSQPKDGYFGLQLNQVGMGTCNFKLIRPEFVNISFQNPDDKKSTLISYLLYISPGDNLVMNADLKKSGAEITLSGKGSNNNQPQLSAIDDSYIYSFYNDTLPNRLIKALNESQKAQQENLDKYIKLYSPSITFVNDWKMSLRYYTADLFYFFKEQNKYHIGKAYNRNFSKWQKITDSLLGVAKLDNDAALGVYHYDRYLNNFLALEKQRLFSEAAIHPESFYQEWYNADTVLGKKRLISDPKNLLNEKIINRYFSGKTAEYMYGVLFANAAIENNPKNIPAIFGRFTAQYPESKFINQFSPMIDIILAKGQNRLNE